MIIRIIKDFSLSGNVQKKGLVLSIPKKNAITLIKNGFAVPIEKPKNNKMLKINEKR